MNADTGLVVVREEARFETAYISALSKVLGKSEIGHELVDDTGGVFHGPVFVCWDAGAERVSWQ